MDPFNIPDNFALPAGDEIVDLPNKVETLRQAFDALGDSIEAHISKRRDELLNDITGGIASLPLTTGEKHAAMKAGNLKADEEAQRFRKGLLDLHADAIREQMRQANAVNERLAGLMRVYPSPQALLSAQNLGDPRRTEYSNQIAHAGRAELTTMARLAISRSDRALAAAVQARLDKLPREDRPFSGADLAQRVVGHEYDLMKYAAQRANHAFQQIVNRHAALQAGRGDLFAKVKSAVRSHNLQRSAPAAA